MSKETPMSMGDCENCGTEGRSREYNQWRPTFPVTGLVCYDLTGVEGIL